MGIDARHPLYVQLVSDWEQMRHTYAGQRTVKEQRFRYLPPTDGMVTDGVNNPNSLGYRAYNSYRMRARVPDFVREAAEAAIGVMHNKPPMIELPEALEPMRERATLRKESLEVLLRRINEAQLICGRLGLLVDFPVNTRGFASDLQSGVEVQTPGPLPEAVVPYIAFYECEKIINWDQGYRDGLGVETLNMVVLDESEFERTDNFEWTHEQKYRLLLLGDNDLTNVPTGTYSVGVFRENNTEFSTDALYVPTFRGNTLDEIPFTIINSKDVIADPDEPPLLGVSDLVLSIYRQDADYKQGLFMQGQDTLVVIADNADEASRMVGAGARLDLPANSDAKFIGVDSKGLQEMRASLENDKSEAQNKAGQLMDTVSRERESGEALNIRVAARTASLKQIALAGAYGLQQTLRHAARWLGVNEEEVVVTPNLDFVDEDFQTRELVQLMTAKTLGAPLSTRSVHNYLRSKDVTSMTFEAELEEIETEMEIGIGSSTPEDLPEDDAE